MSEAAPRALNGFVTAEILADLAHLMEIPTVDAARALPGFSAMARAVAAHWRLPEGEEDRFFAQNLRDLGRFLGSIYALYLHSTPGGLTRTRLAAMLEATNLSGPGRAQALLIFLQFIGYIRPAPAAGDDGRMRRFVPTPRLVTAFRRRVTGELRAMQAMHADLADALAVIDEPGAFEMYLEPAGQCFVAYMILRNPDGGPSLEVFSQRYAGMMLLGELLATAAPDDVFPPVGPMRHSVAALARMAGISRTQVRRAFRDAEEQGFLEFPEEGVALPTDLFRLHLEYAIAGQLLGGTWVATRLVERMRQAQRKRA